MTSKNKFYPIFSFTNTNTFLVFSSISLLLFLSSYPPKVSAVLGADPMSLMRIIKGLCGSSHDQNFANGFYGCYSKLETKEKCIFDNCQKSAFGCTLSSKENIQHSCTAMDKLLPVSKKTYLKMYSNMLR